MSVDLGIPDYLVDTQDKRDALLSSMAQAVGSPWWDFIVVVLEFNIQAVENQAFDTENEPTQEDMKRLRDQKFFMEKVKELPQIVKTLCIEEDEGSTEII